MLGAQRDGRLSQPYFAVVSAVMAVSECIMVVSDMAAVVSAPEVVLLLSPQPASRTTAVSIRIVFIVTPSGVGWQWISGFWASLSPVQTRAKVLSGLSLCKVIETA